MNKNIFLVLLVFFAISCEEAELIEKRFPVAFMQSVDVAETGVTFVASITESSERPVRSYGFIWSEGTEIDSTRLFSSVVVGMASGGFSVTVASDFQPEKSYIVRPVIRTNGYWVVGDAMFFDDANSNVSVLTDFNPKRGDSGDTITISGQYFSNSVNRTSVWLGNDEAEVISVNSEEVRFLVPPDLARSGPVELRLRSGEYDMTANVPFTIDGHRITSVSPTRGVIGESEIVIEGTAFAAAGNEVFVGGYKAVVLEESSSRIRIRLPYTLETGSLDLEVSVNGQSLTAGEQILVKSRWKKVGKFPAEGRAFGYMGNIFGTSVLIGGSQSSTCCDQDLNDVWIYDLWGDDWIQTVDFPGTPRSQAVGFTINGKIYYGMGVHNFGELSDFWEFDPFVEVWRELNSFPGGARNRALYFTLDGFGYTIGGSGNSFESREVWKYAPVSDTWERLGYISSDIASLIDTRDVYVQDDEHAYVIPFNFSSEQIMYEFDPTDPNFFRAVTEVPFDLSQSGRYTPFIIDDVLYLGGDDSREFNPEENPDYWKFDFLSETWERIESGMPGDRQGTNTLVYDGKAYVFFGENTWCCTSTNREFPTDYWTYDPLAE